LSKKNTRRQLFKFALTFLLSLCWLGANATIWRVNSNPQVNAHFTGINEANSHYTGMINGYHFYSCTMYNNIILGYTSFTNGGGSQNIYNNTIYYNITSSIYALMAEFNRHQ
jgi:hypothetical protein